MNNASIMVLYILISALYYLSGLKDNIYIIFKLFIFYSFGVTYKINSLILILILSYFIFLTLFSFLNLFKKKIKYNIKNFNKFFLEKVCF